MNGMSEEKDPPAPDNVPLRRRGDRRTQDQIVADDRRRNNRRDIPGVSALFRTLFRRGTGTDS
jgi:hypothetical protein